MFRDRDTHRDRDMERLRDRDKGCGSLLKSIEEKKGMENAFIHYRNEDGHSKKERV
jgi:hypothetical protein